MGFLPIVRNLAQNSGCDLRDLGSKTLFFTGTGKVFGSKKNRSKSIALQQGISPSSNAQLKENSTRYFFQVIPSVYNAKIKFRFTPMRIIEWQMAFMPFGYQKQKCFFEGPISGQTNPTLAFWKHLQSGQESQLRSSHELSKK